MILAENGGLLKKLLRQMLAGKEDDYLAKKVALRTNHLTAGEAGKLLGLEVWSSAVVSLLCSSRPMAKLIFRLETEQGIFSRFAACFPCRHLFEDNPDAALFVNCTGLRALASLSTLSKRVRALIHDDCSFFSSLLHLASHDDIRSTFDVNDRPAYVVSQFLLTYAMSGACRDSHQWLIEQGFCEAIVRILSVTSEPMTMNHCTKAILLLTEERDCRD
jgi:hypothetical protein